MTYTTYAIYPKHSFIKEVQSINEFNYYTVIMKIHTLKDGTKIKIVILNVFEQRN